MSIKLTAEERARIINMSCGGWHVMAVRETEYILTTRIIAEIERRAGLIFGFDGTAKLALESLAADLRDTLQENDQ